MKSNDIFNSFTERKEMQMNENRNKIKTPIKPELNVLDKLISNDIYND